MIDPFMEYREWMAWAVCAQANDPDLWFPTNYKNSRQCDTALALCAACPVLDECRQHFDQVEANISPGKLHGIMAGERPAERARRRRQARKQKEEGGAV